MLLVSVKLVTGVEPAVNATGVALLSNFTENEQLLSVCATTVKYFIVKTFPLVFEAILIVPDGAADGADEVPL